MGFSSYFLRRRRSVMSYKLDELSRRTDASAPCPHRIECELIGAYVRLEVATPCPDGSRTVALAGVRPLRVRLTELPQGRIPLTMPPLWLEIFSPEGDTIDGCGWFDLGEAELTDATEVIMNAT